MTFKSSFIILILFFINSSTFAQDTCQMKRDVLKQEHETLIKAFNFPEPNPSPTECQDILDGIYKTVDEINEDSFIDSIKGEEFEEARKQYEADRDYMETNFTNTKAFLEEQFNAQEKEIDDKIAYANSEISRIATEQENATKHHAEMVKTYDKCGYQPDDFSSLRTRAFKASKPRKSSDEPTVMCDIKSDWFIDLKKLVDSKVYGSGDLVASDDCNKKRKWFLGVNTVFQEAIDQITASYDIDTYKATLQKRLTDRKREIDDTISQIKKDYERDLQEDRDFLQIKNAELQKVSSQFEELKKQQINETEVLAIKLLECSLYDLADKLFDDVTDKDFMKQVFIKEYEGSKENDKAVNIMRYLKIVTKLCRQFEGYVVLYYEIVEQEDQDSPTMIEIINQIRNLRQPGVDCGVEYDHNDFLSPTLVSNPIVDHILDILSDAIKVGNYDKTITFNYENTGTFQEILSTLVKKSYTGSNLDYLLGFVDELYWLVNKYDVLSQMLDIHAPTSDKDKKKFKDLVDKIAKSDALNNEDTDRLIGLREKMKKYGIQ